MELFQLGLFGRPVPRIVVQVPDRVNENVAYQSHGLVEKIVKPLLNCQMKRAVRDDAKVFI